MSTLTYLSNAGIRLDLGSASLLVDGLYGVEGLPFSPVPQPLLDGMQADYVAVTHAHRDHLDWRKLEAYLAARPVKGVLLPPHVYGQRHGVPEITMKGVSGRAVWPGLTVQWRRTPHLQRAKPAHHSFVVRGGGVSVLVAGDAMPSPELGELAVGEDLDAALVTAPLLQAEEGRALFRARQVLIYHVPSVEDDRWGMRRLALRLGARWGAVPLLTPGETLAL